MSESDTLVVLPTYNEAGHIPILYNRLKALNINADIVFIDDASPDGSGELIDTIAAKDPHVYAIHRAGKSGIGGAHLCGIAYAYDNGYKTLITMDTDLVHKPEDIPDFLEASKKTDIVIGTRFFFKESLKEWNIFRKTLTHLGHKLTKLFLRHDYDSTGGFRVYRIDRINRQAFDLVKARDYEFFFYSLTILHLNGYSISEIPIELPGRVYGTSKMEIKHMAKSLLLMIKLGWICQFQRHRVIVTEKSI